MGLLGEVDEEEVGRVVDGGGHEVDEEMAEKAWQIYQQVGRGRKWIKTDNSLGL